MFLFLCFRPQGKRMASSGELYTYLYLLSLVLTNRMARTKVHEEQAAILMQGYSRDLQPRTYTAFSVYVLWGKRRRIGQVYFAVSVLHWLVSKIIWAQCFWIQEASADMVQPFPMSLLWGENPNCNVTSKDGVMQTLP